MKVIKLTKGYEALVDDEDYERINAYKWFAVVVETGNKFHVSAARWSKGSCPLRKSIKMSHAVLDTAISKGKLVDHINRNPLDNRKENLRITDKRGNSLNSDRVEKASGIYYERSRQTYKAFALSGDGSRKYIGTFRSRSAAVIAKRVFLENNKDSI